MMIIGIDPGKTGGVCIFSEGLMSLLFAMPENIQELIGDFRSVIELASSSESKLMVWLEKSQPMPKQGVTSVFTYGRHFGNLEGIITALKMPCTLVQPREWTKEMHRGTSQDTPKKRSLEAALRLAPSVNFLATPKCKKPHEGLVDAYLIAEYGRRQIL